MPRIAKGERALLGACILLFANGGKASPVVEQEPAVAGGVFGLEANHHEIGAGFQLGADLVQRVGREQRRIAVKHQHLTVEGLDGGPRGFHRIRRPQLLGLHEGRKLRIERRPSGDDVVHPWTDHHGGAAEAGALGGGEHMREQRRAGEPVQHLGPVGFHPRAFARGKDDGQSWSVSHAGSDRCQIVSIVSANSTFRGGEREGNACGQRIPSFKGESRIAAASAWNPIRLVQSWSEGHNPCGCNASGLDAHRGN